MAVATLFDNLLRNNKYNTGEGSCGRKRPDALSIPCKRRSTLRD
jgi:hypothetical protein